MNILNLKKYPYTDFVRKECPFGWGSSKTCSNCRLALERYTSSDIEEYRHKGDLKAAEKAYVCSITALLYETANMNKNIKILSALISELLILSRRK